MKWFCGLFSVLAFLSFNFCAQVIHVFNGYIISVDAYYKL